MGTIRRRAGWWGPAAFAGASVVAARFQDGYVDSGNHVSGLAASGARSAPVMVAGFGILGLSGLVIDVEDDVVRRLARAAGVGTILAGAYRVSSPACPDPFLDPAATRSDEGHALASIVTFVLWTALPLASALRPGPRWYRVTSAVLAATTAAGLATAGWTTLRDTPRKGLVQRAFLTSAFGWYALTSARNARRR